MMRVEVQETHNIGWINQAVGQWLRLNRFDGLWCDAVPCGCELDDLAPCGYPIDECEPGIKTQFEAGDACGCDVQGQAHRHIGPKPPEPSPKQTCPLHQHGKAYARCTCYDCKAIALPTECVGETEIEGTNIKEKLT